MEDNSITNQYFKQFKNKLNYKKINKIIGFEYNSLEKDSSDKVLRILIDENLGASISKIKTNKVCPFKYIAGSDLLIIGYSLEGEKSIDYKGKKNIIKKGEVFYFRPLENFTIELFENSFLCYFINLNSLNKSLYCNNCNGLCLNHICKKGEIHIERSPYVMESYIDEIKEIRELEVESFLDYANIKGKLFNFLTWFVKLNCRPSVDENKCCLHYVLKAKKIIIDNMDRQITVKEIAEMLGISTYKLQKSFKEVKGTTVYNFIRNTKIDNSIILLKNRNLSIIDISQKVGYENPSKFSATFKDITGYTPTEYRKDIKV